PLAARAQQPAMLVVGFLSSETPDLFAGRLRAFRQGLSEAGYVEGRNVAIEYRFADGQYDRLTALAADLVRRQVTGIAAGGVTTATTVALLLNPTDPTAEAQSRDLQAAARTLGRDLHVLHATTERDFDTVFATLVQLRAGALVIGANALFASRSEQLAALALR